MIKVAFVLIQIQQHPIYQVIPTSGTRSRTLEHSTQLTMYYAFLLLLFLDFIFPLLKPLLTKNSILKVILTSPVY